jgi:predicted dehydrogenase
MWTRCFPSVRHVQQLIQDGAIGEPVVVQADFGWSTATCGPEERVWFPESGGLILDVGTYMAQWGQVAFGSNTQVTKIQVMGTTKRGVDHTVLTNIQYQKRKGRGLGFMQFYLTGRANTEERVVIQGTSGRIVVEPPFHIPQRIRLVRDHGRGASSEEVFDFPQPDDSFTSWNYPGSIGFTHQIQAVEQALSEGETECPYFPLEDSLQVAAILDSLRTEILAAGLDEDKGADML